MKLVEILSYPFIQRAIIAGMAVGTVCALLSIFVVLRRMAFIGHGISHAAFGGVSLAIFLNLPTSITTIVFCLATAFIIAWLSHRKRISEDSAIGLTLTMAMALGVILLSLRESYTPMIVNYLFGNILTIATEDLTVTLTISILVLSLLLIYFKDLYILSFNEELAWVSGLPVGFLRFLLLGLLSLTIVASVKLVGIILVSAFLVIPGLCSCQLVSRIHWIAVISLMIGWISTLGGVFASVYFDLPLGPVIVSIQFLIFVVSLLINRPLRSHSFGIGAKI